MKKKMPPRRRHISPRVEAADPKIAAAVAAEPVRTYVWDGSVRSEGADTIVGLCTSGGGQARLWLPPAGVADLARMLTFPARVELTAAQRAETFRSVLAGVERVMLSRDPPGTPLYNATHGLFNLLRTIAAGQGKDDSNGR